MANLIGSLVVPEHDTTGSQETFDSASSQPPPSSITEAASQAQKPTSPTTSQSQSLAFQTAGLPIHDIDTFLADPSNAELLKKTRKANQLQPKDAERSSDSVDPVSLGSKTSHHVSALNHLCQLKGISAVFEINEDASHAGFGGVLKIGNVTVTREERWHSKKEAKQALAEKGLEIVQTMEVKGKEPGMSGEVAKNWVGILNEYYSLSDPNRGVVYNDYAVGSVFACECSIPSRPDHTFGSKTEAFPSKKAARFNSAQKAVEYLISEGHLNPDGSTKARKKVKHGAAVRIQCKDLEVKKEASYAQKVQDICPLLGLTSPQYSLTPTSDQAPNMLNGYASFPNQPDMPKEIGEVRNVFGKKNAKEELAKAVWVVLQGLAQKRGVKIEEAEAMGSDCGNRLMARVERLEILKAGSD
ncbi:hypothetical protein N7G274_005324 [Stereocaulon virgatum]|uniref:DRBM domain-containing protein n=1 Tax=Stereocaulon virgatum TaxID=373712 RepID=A0ABR4ABA5_9LECA